MSRTETIEKKTTETSWDEYVQAFEEDRLARKRVIFRPPRGNMAPLVFVIRELTQAESDEVDAAPVKLRQERRGADVDIDLGSAKDLLIQRGVVEGPPGWKGTERDIRALPPSVRDTLADKIQKFSALDEETRIGFR